MRENELEETHLLCFAYHQLSGKGRTGTTLSLQSGSLRHIPRTALRIKGIGTQERRLLDEQLADSRTTFVQRSGRAES
jgi:hypothetical protein